MLFRSNGASLRKESRGGHTRDDFPGPDHHFGTVNLVQQVTPDGAVAREVPLPEMPAELAKLFEGDDHGDSAS